MQVGEVVIRLQPAGRTEAVAGAAADGDTASVEPTAGSPTEHSGSGQPDRTPARARADSDVGRETACRQPTPAVDRHRSTDRPTRTRLRLPAEAGGEQTMGRWVAGREACGD
jgi:hypothetical protein